MTNAEVARVFDQIAVMLEMEGANPFRVRAYREAARVVAAQPEPMAALAAEEGRLESIKGIGKDLAQKIRDIAATGTTELYEELKKKYPPEVAALTELQGMGPKRVKTLFDMLHVRNRADLERAAKEGKLRELPGFGETLEKNVLKALQVAKLHAGRMLLGGAWPVAQTLAERVRGVAGVEIVELAGSFRRRKETIGDLDILVCGGEPATVMKAFTTNPDVAEVLAHGETKSSVRLRNGLQVDLRLVPESSFGAALLYFTGSKEHNIELRKIAIEKGLSLNEYGLTRGEKMVAGRTEEEVYRALGMGWIPPELREARDEIQRAIRGALPRLIEEQDLKADLHMHTDRTDGRDTLETMVRAARDRGYEYCAITEHSKSLAMARGFDEARVKRSVEEIAAVRKKVPGIEVLHGLEVDILADGALDLSDRGLELLDWVIVALHSRLDQPPAVATQRVLEAISHPRVHAMAHPTARLIGTRERVPFDMEQVLERAAELGVAMEINAQPDRTDLNDANARLAHEKGVALVIDTDAHSTLQLDQIRYGVFAARRAGLEKGDVLNTLPYPRFRERLRRTGGAKPPAAPRAHVEAGAVAHAEAGGDGAAARAKAAAGDRAAARAKSSKPDNVAKKPAAASRGAAAKSRAPGKSPGPRARRSK